MTDETPKPPACQHGTFFVVGKPTRLSTMVLVCGKCLRTVQFEYVPNKTKWERKLVDREKQLKVEANEREFQKLLERCHPAPTTPLAPTFPPR